MSGYKIVWAVVAICITGFVTAPDRAPAKGSIRNGTTPVELSASPNPASAGNTITLAVTLSDTATVDTPVSTGWIDPNMFTTGVRFSNWPSTIMVYAGESTGYATATIDSTSNTGTAHITVSANGGSTSCNVVIQ